MQNDPTILDVFIRFSPDMTKLVIEGAHEIPPPGQSPRLDDAIAKDREKLAKLGVASVRTQYLNIRAETKTLRLHIAPGAKPAVFVIRPIQSNREGPRYDASTTLPVTDQTGVVVHERAVLTLCQFDWSHASDKTTRMMSDEKEVTIIRTHRGDLFQQGPGEGGREQPQSVSAF